MITLLEKKIAFRYLFTKKKDGFINIISTFSFLGIALGVAVLIVVMSVMNGFRSELINKINGFNPHLKIYSYDESIDLTKLKNDKIKNISIVIVTYNSSKKIVNLIKNIPFVTPILIVDNSNDQKNIATPKEAIEKGATYLVMGRSIKNNLNYFLNDFEL